jgi:hypothetical protein
MAWSEVSFGIADQTRAPDSILAVPSVGEDGSRSTHLEGKVPGLDQRRGSTGGRRISSQEVHLGK